MDSSSLSVSPQDRDLMIRTVIGEAGNQPDVGKVAVAHTILNRVGAGTYGANPSAVVLAKGQFEPWVTRSGELMGYGQDSPAYQGAARAVDMALSGQAPDPTGGALNFYSPSSQAALGRQAPSWAKGQGQQIGGHVFYGGKGGQQQGSGTTMAQAQTDPNDISDADIEAMMMGRSTKGAAPASTPAPSTSTQSMPSVARPTAAQAPAAQPSAATQPGEISDDEIAALMSGKGPSSTAAPSAAPGAQPGDATPAGVRPLTTQPRAAGKSPYGTLAGVTIGQQPQASRNALSPFMQQGDTGMAVGRGIVEGVPVIGPYLVSGIDHAGALERSIKQDIPYSQALQQVQGFDQATAAAHPTATTVGNIAGGVASLGGLGATAAGARALGITGENMLMRIAAGGATNAAIGGADAAVRSGGDPTASAIGGGIGLVAGGAGPVVGKGVEMAGNALSPFIQGFRPQAAATNALQATIGATGGDLPVMAQRLADNPRLSLMDVNPGVQDLAQGLAAQPGKARDTLVTSYGQRAAGAKDAVTGAYDAAMGPTPDVLATLDGIKATAASNAMAGFGAALSKAGPVDTSAAIQALDDQIRPGIGQLPSVESGIPLGPVQQRLQQIRAQLSTPDGSEVLTDPARLHKIQSDLRTEADTLLSSSTGSDRLMGRAIMGARNNIVDAIDDATGGAFKPAQKQYASDMAVHDAFNKGLSIFQNRGGVNGLEDRPEYWHAFVANASPAEKQALTLGVRTAADQSMASVKNAALRGETIPMADANLGKLKAVLGDDAAGTLAQRMADEKDIAASNAKLFLGSQTQPRQANKLMTAVRGIGPLSMELGLPSFAAMTGNPDAALAMGALALARRGVQFAGQRADLARNNALAGMVSGSGPAAQDTVSRLMAAAGARGLPTMAQGAGQNVNRLATFATSGAGQVPNLYERPNTLADQNRLMQLHRR